MSVATPTPSAVGDSSWRKTCQKVKLRAMSKRGRRRKLWFFCKTVLISTALGTAVLGGVVFIYLWTNNRRALASVISSEPVRDIFIVTNGTLTKEWVKQTLALPEKISMMALDLVSLRERLLGFDQVRTSVLTRSFPDLLVVSLQERTPVARLQVQNGSGKIEQLFVAKDGTIYAGLNYSCSLFASLPWLDGVHITATDKGYEPIVGMNAVAELFTIAKLYAPHLYRDSVVVSLANFATRDEIFVKSRDTPETIFSSKENFFKQLAQLNYIIGITKQVSSASVESVNLALGIEAIVRMTQTPNEIKKNDKRVSHPFQAAASKRRKKGKRDL